MRYQNKVFTIIIILVAFISIATIKIIDGFQKKTISDYKTKKIIKYGISYKLPLLHNPNIYPKKHTKNGWFTTTYVWRGIGVFRFSVANGKNPDFKKLSVKYFGLDKFPVSGKKFYFPESNLFFKEIPLFDNGAYTIKKSGKRIIYTYFFTLNNRLYWFDFSTRNTLNNYKKFFDKILMSIKSIDKNIKRKLTIQKFSKELESSCAQSFFILCQSIKAIILFPLLSIIIIFLIISKIMSLGGKGPDDNFFSEDFPVFKEEKIDYQLKFQYNTKISTGAFVLTDKNIYIFSFKKPVFIFPRNVNDYTITIGKSFFGGDYIQIKFSNTDYIKRGKTFKTIYRSSDYRLRIFIREINVFKNYLPLDINTNE
jgi:hypothetical protein